MPFSQKTRLIPVDKDLRTALFPDLGKAPDMVVMGMGDNDQIDIVNTKPVLLQGLFYHMNVFVTTGIDQESEIRSDTR